MKQKLIDHIASIKAEQAETMDGLQIAKNLAQEISQIARAAFGQSQNTESVDTRIETLVTGLQNCANHAVETFNVLETKNQTFESKIEALESLLEELEKDEQVAAPVATSDEEEFEAVDTPKYDEKKQ